MIRLCANCDRELPTSDHEHSWADDTVCHDCYRGLLFDAYESGRIHVSAFRIMAKDNYIPATAVENFIRQLDEANDADTPTD